MSLKTLHLPCKPAMYTFILAILRFIITKTPSMDFNVTPQHAEEIVLENVNKVQILIVGIEAAKGLGWKISSTRADGFTAHTNSASTEHVTLMIQNDKVVIKSTSSQPSDGATNKDNVESFITAFNLNMRSISPEEIISKYELLKNDMHESHHGLDEIQQRSNEKAKNWFSIFIPVEGYFIMPILIDINILIFILMAITGVNIITPDSESLINWGANFRPSTLDGQPWRLFTSCFLHIGIIHLVMNMYALTYVGILLEPLLGRTRFLSAYMLCGLAGSALSLFWHPYTISAGASGAIFGMYGVFLAMLTTSLIEKSARQTFLTTTLVFVGFNLINGLRGGIDNAAHLGGLLSGLVIGYSFYPGLIKPEKLNLKYGSIAVMTLLIACSSYTLYSKTTNDYAIWQQQIEKFGILETEALNIYNQKDLPRETRLKNIAEKGIHNWEESIRILQEADALDIPEMLHKRNGKMLAYCELRLESFKLYYKSIGENTRKYDIDLNSYSTRIDSIVKELIED